MKSEQLVEVVVQLPFIQTEPDFCCLYVLANYTGSDSILKFKAEKYAGLFAGMNTAEENELLKAEKFPFRIEHLIFINSSYGGIQSDLVRATLSSDIPDEGFYIPYVLGVRKSEETKKLHRVLLLAGNEGFYLVDSLLENVYKIPLERIFSLYYQFFQVDRLTYEHKPGEWEFAWIPKDVLKHLIK